MRALEPSCPVRQDQNSFATASVSKIKAATNTAEAPNITGMRRAKRYDRTPPRGRGRERRVGAEALRWRLAGFTLKAGPLRWSDTNLTGTVGLVKSTVGLVKSLVQTSG